MDPFEIRWEVREDGTRIKSGLLDPQDVPAGETREIRIDYVPLKMTADKEYYLRVNFNTREASDWAEAGHEVTFSEFKLGDEYKAELAVAPSVAPKVQDKGGNTISLND